MTISPFQVIRLALVAFFASSGCDHPEFADAQFTRPGCSSLSIVSQQVLAAPGATSSYSFEADQNAAHIKLIRDAEELLEKHERTDRNWVRVAGLPRALLGFPKPAKGDSPSQGQRILRALDEVLTPAKVQELLQRSENRRSAIALLRSATGLQICERSIDAYIRRHSLTFVWQKAGWRIDPQRVQDLVQNTHSRAEAAHVLQTALGWSGDLSNVSSYLKRHGLKAPWQIRNMHIDPNEVQVLIERTRNRAEAVEILRSVFAGRFHPDELSRYLRRHGLTAPWQRKSRQVAPGRVNSNESP